jgi:histo-blood group ABO system transferase
MKIGLLNIATNKYLEFVKPFYESMQKYLLQGTDCIVTPFLFTNLPQEVGVSEVEVIEQRHYPWPGMTLRRYEIFCKNSNKIDSMDYLFYCDIDMLFEGYVGKEILGVLMGTRHPGYWNTHRNIFPYDKNSISKAYVGPTEGSVYFAGGFNGGKTKDFLNMSEAIYKGITEDQKIGYVAEWHDESHINRYFIDHPPETILDPSYCFPKGLPWAEDSPYKNCIKLRALVKNHSLYQI